MGLASALSTALTGLTAAETTIDVVGNNVANGNTVGFKASTAFFATQFLQTQTLGSGPTSNRGGTNPRQTGLGTQVAEIKPDFNQGTIEISSNPSDLAIQGDGFFIVQGPQGENFYTRNGIFKTNSENQLVTITGQRLLGHGVNDRFEIQTTTLQPLSIPLGAAAVAQATRSVFLEGALRPNGDLATISEVIQSTVLSDARFSRPAIDQVPPVATTPLGSGATAAPSVAGIGVAQSDVAGTNLAPGGVYRYKIVFAEGPIAATLNNSEGLPSAQLDVTLTGTNDRVDLSTLPTDSSGIFTTRRIYRTLDLTGAADPDVEPYYFVGAIGDMLPASTFTDTTSDATLLAADQQLNQGLLNGTTYEYRITFVDASGRESRPSDPLPPQAVTDGRIRLTDLPIDDQVPPQWTQRRIYRNVASAQDTYYLVGEIDDATTTSVSFIDGRSDADLIAANEQIDFNGVAILESTFLSDVLRRDGDVYSNVFQEGTLEFTGRKGGLTLATKSFDIIDGVTTVGSLLDFFEQALGIQVPPGPDSANPIPSDSGLGVSPGGRVTSDGRIQLIANTGDVNAVEIGLSGLELVTSTGSATVNLPFNSAQAAVGEGEVADFIVYDSLGIPLSVRVTTVLESRSSTSTVYRWFADSADNDPLTGAQIAVGTGLIRFDGEGNVSSVTESRVSIDRSHVSSQSPLEFDLDFSALSGLAVDESSLAATRQDGSAPGTLASFIIGEDGVIRGVFSNGVSRDLGQIRLARFANPAGLEQRGQNLFAEGINSGLPIEGNPNQQGIGTIIAGAVELSNTDIGANLIDLILASTQYRGNTRVITAAQQLLDELLNLRR